MLPRQNRLVERNDFKQVYLQGKFTALGDLSLKWIENGYPEKRIGFSLEKKYFRKAVTRNRIRRILREATRQLLADIRPGYDIIFFCRKAASLKNVSQAQITVKKLLNKSHLLQE